MLNLGILTGGYLSLLFYRILIRLNRPWLTRIFRSRGEAPRWHPLSRWLQADSRRVFAMMLIGPRWNCGGILGITDSFRVAGHIRLRADQAGASADHWTAVVYDMRFATVAHVGNRNAAEAEAVIELPAGEYLLAIRYYGTNQHSCFPEILVDDRQLIPQAGVGNERRDYQAWLRGLVRHPDRWLFSCMHYHAWAFLKLRDRLNAAWVNRLYLPVGNPETGFTYGTVDKGQRLYPDRPIEDGEIVYLALYDRASLPVFWCRLDAATAKGGIPVKVRGTWLLRRITSDMGGPVYMRADSIEAPSAAGLSQQADGQAPG